jgi:hypothetical protein
MPVKTVPQVWNPSKPTPKYQEVWKGYLRRLSNKAPRTWLNRFFKFELFPGTVTHLRKDNSHSETLWIFDDCEVHEIDGARFLCCCRHLRLF